MNLLGALSLRTDKPNYRVGDVPTYILEGGQPGAALAWSSQLNGNSTGEYQAQYGQYLNEDGAARLIAGGPWTEQYKGYWKKEILAIMPDGSVEVARVNFSVSDTGAPVAPPAVVAPGTITTDSGIDGLISGNYTLPVIGSVPKVVVLGGAGLLLFFLTSKK